MIIAAFFLSIIMKEIENIRNIGIIAHIDAGKTTTTERMLFNSGKIHRMGEVDDGTTITDFLEQEKERGITIASAVVSLKWKDRTINIIDTPGHVDFTAEVERSLRILDGAVVIFSAVEGVESQSETVWHQADSYNVPRIVYVNKLDRMGADYNAVIDEMKDKFFQTPLILQLPIGKENAFKAIIDLVDMKKLIWNGESGKEEINICEISAEEMQIVKCYRDNLIEIISDHDDQIAETYLEGKEVDVDKLKKVIRDLTVQSIAVPVFCGASKKNIGIHPIMDSIVDYLPSPLDNPITKVISVKDNKIQDLKLTPDSPFLGLIFKIVSDVHVGRLLYMRVYSGSIKNKTLVKNTTIGKKEIIQKIFSVNANKKVEIDIASMGDIVEITGPKFATTGHTLTNYSENIYLEKLVFPEPVVSVAIEPRTSASFDKLFDVLNILSQEDPTFRFSEEKETGQLLISGMGELYLEVIVERLKREFNIPVNRGKPRVAYKESISLRNIVKDEFVRSIGGKKYIIDVELEVSPLNQRKCIFNIKRKLKNILPRYIKILIGKMENNFNLSYLPGPLAGFPLMGIEINLINLSFNDEQIVEAVLASAIETTFEKACSGAAPIILEPLMKIELFTPEEYIGEVMKSLNALFAKVTDIEDRNRYKVIHSEVPLSKTFGYTTYLRGLTKGKASYTMQFSRYEKLTDIEQKEILKKFRGF